MATKSDLPNANVVGSGNLTSEMAQYNYLYSLLPRSSSGDITFTSSSSNIPYSTAIYSSGKYANQGQNGMLSILGEILASYVPTSTDFNNKVNVQDFSYLVDTSATPNQVIGTVTGFTAYTAGSVLKIKAANTNTGATTVNVTSLGIQTLKKFTNSGISDLTSGDMPAGSVFFAIYDGTNYISNLGLTSHLVDLSPHSAATNIPRNTTANLTYYVDTTNGLDTNDGLLAGVGHAFKTVAKAISLLPQIINHAATINVADGTYNETINLLGKSGSGGIVINGNVTTPANCIISNVAIANCSLPVTVKGFTATTTTLSAFQASNCININFSNCISTSDGKTNLVSGADLINSLGIVQNCQFSNKTYGIIAENSSTLYSSTNTGATNTTGIYAYSASTIGMNGTQPGGTTAQGTANGGVIR